ncbi:hypothetical protein Misp01_60590 [Microtetraspora sp. NBRC 13810]|uniref:hypothetical protein n=1 Tax=Microtetraspora sp. NBRC 13810 TaxID=3030990 RepID=UPI0024A13D68|nr:hypothetical protein [Microtetraspora sp. NBRC 13810]GLW10931.1 hypothetical protein Misp01_60590 [Microtetraspora sp. NBRC 13810]
MPDIFLGWWRARTVRPLLWWTLGVIGSLLPVPQHLVLALIVWLGVALTITVRRIRESGRQALDTAGRVRVIADRIADAVTGRVRHTGPPPARDYGHPAAAAGYASPAPELPRVAVYCPGVLLAAVRAVLAAEGIPTHSGPAPAECAQLLTRHGIALLPGAPGPTARTLAGLRPGAARPYRAAPPALLAAAIAAILAADGVLPARLHPADADALTADTAALLDALDIVPHPGAGPSQAWPVLADIAGGW